MNKTTLNRDVTLIILAFIGSRIILHLLGLRLMDSALLDYWQYLDVDTLKNNLLVGVWYDHSTPPMFNLFLGVVLKTAGDYAIPVFAILLKLVSVVNALLLMVILKRLVNHNYLPVIIALVYLLSPATMVYELELFYVLFITLLLLVSCYFLLSLSYNRSWKNVLGFFIPLIFLCYTRSMYHLYWLVLISIIVLVYFWKKPGTTKIILTATISIGLVSAWYIKNKIIFDKFSASTWLGMNMARNVFHDAQLTDSSNIGYYRPFSPISTYNKFLTQNLEEKYKGLNDKDLLAEMKNDGCCMNMKHVSYMEVSDKYMEACKTFVAENPKLFAQNVVQSAITYFAPGTRYTLTKELAARLKYYDAIYSFNLVHFAEGKQQNRITLAVSAIPKMLLYFLVFFFLIKMIIKERKISLLNLFIVLLIGYGFSLTSLIEHYENMRFRYEIEPLFYILFIQVAAYKFGWEKRPQKSV